MTEGQMAVLVIWGPPAMFAVLYGLLYWITQPRKRNPS